MIGMRVFVPCLWHLKVEKVVGAINAKVASSLFALRMRALQVNRRRRLVAVLSFCVLTRSIEGLANPKPAYT